MKRIIKRIAAMSAAVMMMSTMAIGVSAATVSDSYNKLVYTGSETKTNYYVTYSQGKNKTSEKRFMYVSSIIYNNSNTILAENHSEGSTASKGTRSCYTNLGASTVYKSYHRSILKTTTNGSSSVQSQFGKYITYK